MRKQLKIDAFTAAASQDHIDQQFATVGERLKDGRRYLVGNRFTAADLTFASLAAPILLPEHFGDRVLPLDKQPPLLAELIQKWRNTQAGQFAMRMYADERSIKAGKD